MGSTPVPRTSSSNYSGTSMKTLLPWIIAALALGGAWFFRDSSRIRSAEVARLRQEVQELAFVREENAALRTNRLPREEVEQLRKDNRDLLRLRNEIQQLRNERQQLTQQAALAQAAAQQAAAQVQTAQMQVQTLASNAAYVARLPAATSAQVQQTACIQNLQRIQAAKRQWSLEHKKGDDVLPDDGLLEYFNDNVVPHCPAGGHYTLNAVAVLPTCTMPGHVLASE
jgi:hypothetical protein